MGHSVQARALVCGPEGAGQAHLAPALLAALEALPVHAIGLPNLLSDANSRCVLVNVDEAGSTWVHMATPHVPH
jgi:hypothetical protein